MKIIDSHCHLGVWNNPDFFGRKITPGEIFANYDEWGVGGCVIMPTDRADNEEILNSLAEYPKEKYRFVPWVKPDDKSILDFCTKNLKRIAGLKFHPSLDKTRITDPVFGAFIKLACDNNLSISVHCGRWEEMAGWKFPLEIASTNKNLRVILAHMGGDTPKLAFGAIDAVRKGNLKNVYLDTAGFREYWVIESGVKLIGADKFLFASDYPLGHPQAGIALIKHLSIKDREKEMILGRNAAEIFGFKI